MSDDIRQAWVGAPLPAGWSAMPGTPGGFELKDMHCRMEVGLSGLIRFEPKVDDAGDITAIGRHLLELGLALVRAEVRAGEEKLRLQREVKL